MPTIRPATIDDLAPLSQLLDGYRRFYGQPGDIDAARDFLIQRLGLGDAHLRVAESATGRLVGFVQLYPLLSTVGLAPRWLLNDLFVAPEARGQGVGRALMQAAAALAGDHGVPQLTLSTQVDNHAAQALYESLGWQRNDDFFGYRLALAPRAGEAAQ
ncbi:MULTISPECIES: GNAT family N-acetyltransferase [unclassified Modicisalibacter]|uniref:GNAT family N-acetyltransferase n=1 Tax=unclassified Modicisalibacter TaxID=2679913 RepID=UPI001CCBD45C|nr:MULTISPECIES: GNAT family N-acetyltransferase [unclassified Modicisalibacter]MBZ9557863.1 GNAT family N-acetyltransferase [Modicisalibacter sp. R2A 31.J]MBZ9573471.1 GNAT family N-acetyltransferase [Modicisalibacter sp. MOD 31.J]